MDITERFREIGSNGSNLSLRVTAKIYDLHGQVSEARLQTIKKQAYSEISTEITDSGVVGSAKGNSSEKAIIQAGKIKEQLVEVATFPKNKNGKFVAPLGGSYGYIMGAMKASVARKFGDTSKKNNPAYGTKGNLSIGTAIEPAWIEVADKIYNEPDKPLEYLIQKRNVFTYFDYVKESLPFTFTINVDSGLSEDVLLNLLSFIERVGLGPKRRGIMKIERVEKL